MTVKSAITFWVIGLIFCAGSIRSQAQFSDQTASYGINHVYGSGMSGGGVSFCDFDGDGYDDLTLGSSEGRQVFFYKNNQGQLEKLDLLPGFTEETKSILWADLDNDGDKDLFVCVFGNHNRLFRNNGNLELEDVTDISGISLDGYTSYGACIGDYNRDGLPDIYVSQRRVQTDGLPNRSLLYKNNGNLTFTDVTVQAGAEDGGKTPFCSAFIDINNDKWPDIYTAHDRRRGNSLLINNKNGTFTEVAASYGANLEMDGMSVSTADVNQDGYMDIYVSNSEAGNALFINQQGQSFTNESSARNVSFNGIAWGTNFLDGDNDGDDDLYVSSMLVGKQNITSTYYTNEHPFSYFTKGEQVPSDTVSSFNNAVGDINNDGFPDIIVSNSVFPTSLLKNVGNENKFIAFQLVGVESNRDAIGSLISVYSSGRVQRKYVQCGLGFLGQNSNKIIFGLHFQNAADSIDVLWPSGHLDRYRFVAGNTTYTLVEGGSTGGVIRIDPELTTLVEDITETDEWKIYPNPAQDWLEWKNSTLQLSWICIHDAYGKICSEYVNPGNKIDISRLYNGFYALHGKSSEGNLYFQKIIIQK